MARYAEWAPTRAELASHRIRTALRWPLRPLRRLLQRIEGAPALIPLWERRAGPNYTGWTVRNLHDAGTLTAGEVGTVTGYTLQHSRRHYTVTFAKADLLTDLPAPGDIDLLAPPS